MTDINPRLINIQKIVEILNTIKNKIDSNTDVVRSGFNSSTELINDIDSDIKKLHEGDYEILGKLTVMFAPTGAYQELSISNGWGEEFLKLAERFDYHLEKFRSPLRFSWFAKLNILFHNFFKVY